MIMWYGLIIWLTGLLECAFHWERKRWRHNWAHTFCWWWYYLLNGFYGGRKRGEVCREASIIIAKFLYQLMRIEKERKVCCEKNWNFWGIGNKGRKM